MTLHYDMHGQFTSGNALRFIYIQLYSPKMVAIRKKQKP